MFTYTTDDIVASVSAIDAAGKRMEDRTRVHGFRLGLVQVLGLAVKKSGDPMGADLIVKHFDMGTYSRASLKRYLVGSPMALKVWEACGLDEDEDGIARLAQVFATTSQVSATFGPTVKADERDEVVANTAVYVNEGMDPVAAAKQAGEDRKTFLEAQDAALESQSEEEVADIPVEGDGHGDVQATGDPGRMSVADRLGTALRLLEGLAEDDTVTPTELALHKSTIGSLWDAVAAVDNKVA